jgi:hypothetical protein
VVVSFQWLGKEEAEAPPAPAPVELAPEEGVFQGRFSLPAGRWQVAVAGRIGDGAPAVATRKVRSVYDQVMLTVSAQGGFSRITVTVDGEVVTSGQRLSPGESAAFTAGEEIVLRAGNARAATVSVNGVDYGAMGERPEVVAWLIRKGEKPVVAP